MTSLKFTVLENGLQFSVSQMSEPESAAIGECVDDLLPAALVPYWFESDLCLLDEDEDEMPSYGRVWCYTNNPKPKDTSLGESRIPHPLPKELLDALQGKTFRVHPRQLGLNPWGEKVEVVFETLV